jgi:hypothetical protein
MSTWTIDEDTGDPVWVPSPPEPEPDQAAGRLRRYKMIEGDLDDLIDELIDSGAIGLSAATSEQLAAAKALLARIPAPIRRAIFRRGRVRITRGDHVDGTRYAGLTRYRAATVAGDHPDAEATFLHELGHILDNATGWQAISNGEAWLTIWRTDQAAGRVPDFSKQQTEPAEYFAESAAQFWIGEGGSLSAGVQGYMRSLPRRFGAIA